LLVPNSISEFLRVQQLYWQLDSSAAFLYFDHSLLTHVLAGAHTIGQARCLSFTNRLYPTQDPTLNPALATWLKTQCPATGGNPNNPVNLDFVTPLTFDNQYYKNLVQFDGLLTSDEELFTDPSTASIIQIAATNSPVWQAAFVQAMIKMGNLANTSFGEIRLDPLCQVVNP
jgi:peroxidase